ncbi:MAG: glutamine amidotransferase [Clostridia bacterium]|nr:glutamine amidotransferase [Clostridia bacterium]
MKINIVHLYPDLLNLYGDNGNITAFAYRLRQRGIEADITEIQCGDMIDISSADIVFIGGGSERELLTVADALRPSAKDFQAFASDGGVMLAVCGGYQLLGSHYVSGGKKIGGLGVLDIFSDEAPERFIGNIVCECEAIGTTLAGFENHSGKMNIGSLTPLAKVISGSGNDGASLYEGVIAQNVIGTWLHGPLLPKNPKLTDYILTKAIERKYGKAELAPLDDTAEMLAHDYSVKMFS